MSISLYQYGMEETKRLSMFLDWYASMSKIAPEEYPMSYDDDNAGVWGEMFADYDPATHTIPSEK